MSPAVQSRTQAVLVARDAVTQRHRLDGLKTLLPRFWVPGIGSGGVGQWVPPGGSEASVPLPFCWLLVAAGRPRAITGAETRQRDCPVSFSLRICPHFPLPTIPAVGSGPTLPGVT